MANQTSATFLRVVGSELIQKYLGDGPKLVRELFRVAEEHAPAIVFIDEIDAVGTKRCVLKRLCGLSHVSISMMLLSRSYEYHDSDYRYTDYPFTTPITYVRLLNIPRSSLSLALVEGTIPILVAKGKFSELCWSSSTNWTVSILVEMSK